jgi:hypothetical protein
MLKIRIPRLDGEWFFMAFLIAFWGKDTVLTYFRAVLLRIPYIRSVADYFIPTLLIACLIPAIPFILRAVSPKDLVFFIGCSTIFLFHALLFPDNGEYLLSLADEFFLILLPLYAIGLRMDTDRDLKALYICSMINVCAFCVYILTTSGETDMQQILYSGFMHRAYTLLPQLLIVLGYAFKKLNALNLSVSVLGVVLLIACGNRGSIVVLSVFVMLGLLFLIGDKLKKAIYAAAFSLGIVCICFYRRILALLNVLIAKLGMSPRLLNYLTEGDFFRSDSRTGISELMLRMISKRPLVGYGLTADHVITGSYAHNFAIELWMSFGVIVGSVLLLGVACVVLCAWLHHKNDILLTMLLCAGFFKLFISSSFLMEGLFFVMLGYCVSLNRKVSLSSGREGAVV